MDDIRSSSKLPKVALAAVVLAFVVGVAGLIVDIVRPMYFAIPGPVLLIAAGVTILRRRAWGGYGLALVISAEALLIPFLFADRSPGKVAMLILLVTFSVGVALLFFFAGRALSQTNAKPGARWPWVTLALLLNVPALFVRAYIMPTGSMENTLLIGDRLLVRTFPRPTPKRGDLLVFHYPVDTKQIFVKRVIGVGGDRIRIENRVVYLNGSQLAEPYTIHQFPPDRNRDNLPVSPEDRAFESGMPGLLAERTEMLKHHVTNGEVIVPAGKYFVLGDNRDNSLDSRCWGFVDRSELIGEPFVIYASEAKAGTGTGRARRRFERVFKLL